MLSGKEKRWLGQVPLKYWIIFFSTLGIGIIAHGMALFNKISFGDDIEFLFGTGNTIALGRWMLHILAWLEDIVYLDGHFSLPVYNGVISICCIAVAACLLTDLMEIRKTGYGVAIGFIMVTFPVVTSLFAYMFTVHFYMVAMLMTVVSAYLLCKMHKWWVWGLAVILGGSAIGIYQAFFPMAAAIIILHDLRMLTEEDSSMRNFWKGVGAQTAGIAGMMVLYFAANSFFLHKFQMELSGYMGIGEISATPVSDYFIRFGRAYREFFLPEKESHLNMYPQRIYTLYQLMLLGDLILGMKLTVMKGRKNPWKAILAAVLLILFPLGCNLIYVMGDNVHGLMTYAPVLQVVLFVWLMDRQTFESGRWSQALSLLSAGVLAVTGVFYVRLANQCYFKVMFKKQEMISYYTTLVTQIKSSEEYRADRPVLFLNQKRIKDPTITVMEEMETIHTMGYQFNTKESINGGTWAIYMERWCGFTPKYYDGEDMSGLAEVRAMPHYPDAGSMKVINDVLVVNF